MDRLPFRLPNFTRVAWVSDRAREVWAPRLKRLRAAWLEIEWRSVAAGIRACAVLSLGRDIYPMECAAWVKQGLQAIALAGPSADRHAVGTMTRLVDFDRAWQAGDQGEIARLLGQPACCMAFHHHTWVEEGMEDTTWPMAVASAGATGTTTIEIGGPPQANILWRWLGVRAVPHLPCRFDCAATAALADQLIRVGRESGHAAEMDWLLDILGWPVEWSALHGIAEIKTPVLKVSTRTDATARKYTVRRTGTSYPAEGARGLQFPYQVPARPLLTLSRGFQRGLDNPIAACGENAGK